MDKGNITRIEQWNSGGINPITTISYDSYGNPVTITDPRGNSTTTVYDSVMHAFPVQVTNALGHTATTEYDTGTGNVTKSTNENGYYNFYEYDVFGRIKCVREPGQSCDEGLERYFYHDELLGNPNAQHMEVWTRTSRTGQAYEYIWSKTYFDGLGRTYKTEAPGESGTIVSETTYNSLGIVSSQSAPHYTTELAKWENYEYDPVARVKKVIHADGTFRTYAYNDWVVTQTDENGKVKINRNDAYGRLVQVEERNGTQSYYTNYAYNILGNLTSVTDAKGKTTLIEYDTLGRKIRMTEPDMGKRQDGTIASWEYGYDANGNLTYQKDANGNEVWLYYDALNRLILKDYPPANPPDTPGPEDVVFVYDTGTGLNLTGRLAKAIDPNGVGYTEFSYDGKGRVIEIRKVIDGTMYITQSSYDSMDRLMGLRYPDGEVVNYTYSSASGLLKSVSGNDIYLQNATYNALGQINTLSLANNTVTQYTYDQNNFRLNNITTTGPSGTIQNLSYNFDNVGNVIQITDAVGTASQTFSYDDLYRLKSANGSYGNISEIVYDEAGNRTSMTLGTKITTYTTDTNTNRLLSYVDPEKEEQDKIIIQEAYREMLYNIKKIADEGNNRFKECEEETEHREQKTDDRKSKDKGCEEKEEHAKNEQPTYFDVVNDIYAELVNFTIKAKMDIWTFMGKLLQYQEVQDVLNRFNERIAEVGWYAYFDTEGKKIVKDFVDVLEDIDITEITGAEHDPVFSYDNNGNLIYDADSGMSVEYNVDNKPTVIRDSGGNVVVQYFYDAFGARVKKVTQNAVTTYIGSLMEIENTRASKHYFAGAMRIASRVNWDTSRASFSFGPWRLGCSCNVRENRGQRTEDRPYRIFGAYGKQMQNEFIANLAVVLIPLFMIILLRMGLLYYKFASPNHKRNILHIMLILAFLSGIIDTPRPAHAQTPSAGELVFYHTDHLGSTTAITDATGNVLQLLEYDPWGQVTKDIGDNYAHYRYTGQEYDPEIGLYNYKARLYAPGIGRFISPDPIVPDPANPQSLNRYAYVLNNPLRYVDPSGYGWWKKFWRSFEKTFIRPIAKAFKKYGGYIVGGLIILGALALTIATGGAAAPILIGAIAGGIIGQQVGGQWGFALGAFAGALAGWASTGFSTFGLGGGEMATGSPALFAEASTGTMTDVPTFYLEMCITPAGPVACPAGGVAGAAGTGGGVVGGAGVAATAGAGGTGVAGAIGAGVIGGAAVGAAIGAAMSTQTTTTTPLGYHDVNVFAGYRVGIVAGRIWSPSYFDPQKTYEYLGVGLSTSPVGVALTYTPWYNPAIGLNYALQVNYVVSFQFGYSPAAGFYWESGVGGPQGISFQIFEIREAPFFK